MIKVGIIGYGLSGRYLQAPFFEASSEYLLVGIVTKSSNPKEQFPNVKVLSTVDELFNDATIDLISVCSPSDTHFEYAKKAILAGKHVLVEKPFTPTLLEAIELFELAKNANKIIAVFQNRRFDGDFLTVKKILKSGVLGDLLQFEAHFDRYKPSLNPRIWKENIQPGNGVLYDLGSHILDQALCLFGSPICCVGEKYTQREGSDIDDAFDMKLNYGRLKVRLSASLMVKHQGPRYTLHGTKGSFIKYGIDVQEDHLKEGLHPNDPNFGIESETNFGLLNIDNNGEDTISKIVTEKGNWEAYFQNLAEVIKGNSIVEVKDKEILEQIRILEIIERVD